MFKKMIVRVVILYLIAESVLGFTTFALFLPSVKLTSLTADSLEGSPEFSEYDREDAKFAMDSNHYLLRAYSKHIDYSEYKIVHVSLDIENHTWLRSMRNVQVTFTPADASNYLYYTNEAVLINIGRQSHSEYGLSIVMDNKAYSKWMEKKLPGTLTLTWGYGNRKVFQLDQI